MSTILNMINVYKPTCGKGSVALNDVVDAGHLLQSVNVLCVVPQQLPTALNTLDELVTRRRLELTNQKTVLFSVNKSQS